MLAEARLAGIDAVIVPLAEEMPAASSGAEGRPAASAASSGPAFGCQYLCMHEAIRRIEADIRGRYPETKRIYIEAESLPARGVDTGPAGSCGPGQPGS